MSIDAKIYTSGSGNWTKPSCPRVVRVITIGGGGGGGGGSLDDEWCVRPSA